MSKEAGLQQPLMMRRDYGAHEEGSMNDQLERMQEAERVALASDLTQIAKVLVAGRRSDWDVGFDVAEIQVELEELVEGYGFKEDYQEHYLVSPKGLLLFQIKPLQGIIGEVRTRYEFEGGAWVPGSHDFWYGPEMVDENGKIIGSKDNIFKILKTAYKPYVRTGMNKMNTANRDKAWRSLSDSERDKILASFSRGFQKVVRLIKKYERELIRELASVGVKQKDISEYFKKRHLYTRL